MEPRKLSGLCISSSLVFVSIVTEAWEEKQCGERKRQKEEKWLNEEFLVVNKRCQGDHFCAFSMQQEPKEFLPSLLGPFTFWNPIITNCIFLENQVHWMISIVKDDVYMLDNLTKAGKGKHIKFSNLETIEKPNAAKAAFYKFCPKGPVSVLPCGLIFFPLILYPIRRAWLLV